MRKLVLFFLSILGVVHSLNASCFAQTDVTELARDRNLPINTAPYLPPEQSSIFYKIITNLHASYGLSFMGPRLAGSGNETYNIFLPDVAPVQLSHTWQLGYQVSPSIQIGASLNSIQNIADGVVGKTGFIYGKTFETYDPELYINLPSLIQIPNFFVFTSASLSLPLTEFSQKNHKITQISLNQSWTYTATGSDWSFGGALTFQPIFFQSAATPPFYHRTVYASFGHLVSYRISPIINIQSTSTLDFDYRSPSGITSNLDDTSRVAIYLSPMISSKFFVSLGGYVQFLLWNPTAETSILGLDFSISL